MQRTIEFLDASGHIALEWDPHDAADVARALVDFETMKAAGYSFFRVVALEAPEFDPALGRLEARRIANPDEVAPQVEPVETPDLAPKRPRGRPRGSGKRPTETPAAAPARVVAGRPMRGG